MLAAFRNSVVLVSLLAATLAGCGEPQFSEHEKAVIASLSLAGVPWNPWFFWDGRRDSLWAQAITPLEDPVEHAGNRTAYVRFMFENFHARYERIFGPFPPLDGLPRDAS